jgi:hypothetical protein
VAEAIQPGNYREPTVVWSVECRHPEETEPGMDVIELGTFSSEEEARGLLHVAPERYKWATDFRLNVLTVHHAFADWEWDR